MHHKNFIRPLYLLIGITLFLLGVGMTSCSNHKRDKQEQSEQAAIYTCPMHPQIIRDQPGKCPICGMDLVKKENANQEITRVDLETLLKPTNSFAVSQIPITTLQNGPRKIPIAALGRVDYDTRLVTTIAARVSGRIEKLYVKYRYQHIHKGAAVMEIYSPELLTAQQDLLFLLKNDATNASLIQAAKQKLLLLGMSSEQLQQIISSGKAAYTVTVYSNESGHIHEAGGMETSMGNTTTRIDLSKTTEELPVKEGMYVKKGQTVFKLYNTDRSWIVLNLFAGTASLIKIGTPVTITPETDPDKNFHAAIDFIEPFYRNDSKTLTARVYFNNASLQIPIGSQVKALMNIKVAGEDWLPKEAVLSLGLKQVVLLKQVGGFKVQEVQTGITSSDAIQIISGISSQDSVAANAQFLMDSESFIKTK